MGQVKGITPLHQAVSNKHIGAVRALVELGADINARATGTNNSLKKFHHLIWKEPEQMVQIKLNINRFVFERWPHNPRLLPQPKKRFIETAKLQEHLFISAVFL